MITSLSEREIKLKPSINVNHNIYVLNDKSQWRLGGHSFTRSASLNRNKGLEPSFLLVETVDQPGRADI